MDIQVRITKQYGNERIYVCKPETAHCIAILTGQKTISREQIKALKDMGHTFTIEQETI